MKKNIQGFETSEMVMRELKRYKHARRLQVMCDYLNIGLALSIALALLSTALKMIFNARNIPLQVFVIFPLLSFILSLVKPVSLKEAALLIDKTLKLKERLTTAVDFMDKQGPYAALLFRDSLKKIKEAKPLTVFPLKLNRAVSLSVLLCGMLIFYNYYDFTKEERAKINSLSPNVKSAMLKEGERLKQIADKAEAGSSPEKALDKELILKLESIGEGLQSEDIDKHDALLMLTDASETVKRLYRKEKGESEETSSSDKSTAVSEEMAGDELENALDEILNSIESAKRRIAEADIEPGRGTLEGEPGKSSFAKNMSRADAVSEMAGGTENSVSTSDASATGNGSTESKEADKARRTKDLEFPPDSIILKYPDSVISLESLPGKYHKIVKDYFDAVSGGR
ncbi:MAG: hypothetical protein HY809_08975 [Nitrospirae bacterium]|nr:hypothetical protein [Nitrospirota bacterium]